MSAEQRRLLVGIGIAALALRAALMFARGDYLMYDEGYYLLLARALRDGEGFRLGGLPHVALSPLQPLLVAALSWLGIPLLAASRMLAAGAGALLVLPVAAIGVRLAGPRAGLVAAALVAAAPALMTFVPFFPGRSWNLYFGSEPLYLLVAFGALALAMRADEAGGWGAWAGTGALAAAVYLTRGEGVVLAPLLLMLLAARLLVRRAPLAAWRGWTIAATVGLLCAAPYLLHLRDTLGRWAFSGRVQAVATTADGARSRIGPARGPIRSRGVRATEDFVWRGEVEGIWRSTYRLDRTGTRMSSQYWGVAPRPSVPSAVAPPVAAPAAAAPATLASASPAAPEPGAPAAEGSAPSSRVALFGRAIALVVPLWLLALALAGLAAHRARGRLMLWSTPVVASVVLPAVAAYIEPRSFLALVPLAAIAAALALERVGERVSTWLRGRARAERMALVVPSLAACATLALVSPALGELRDALAGGRPLQEVAAGRRAVAMLLDARLPPDAIIASWHPSVGYFADRDWRVLPYEPLDRIIGYARAQGVSAIVLSRFEPSPLADPTHPFQVLLLDPAAPPPDMSAPHLATVEEMPLVVVRRVLPAGAR